MHEIPKANVHLVERQSVSLDALNQLAEQPQWADYWLQFVLTEIPALASALLTLTEAGESLKPTALWPNPCADIQELGNLIEDSIECQRAIVVPPAQGTSVCGLAYPVSIDERICAVFACRFDYGDAEIESVLSQVEKVCLWLEVRLRKQLLEQQRQRGMQQEQLLDGILTMNKSQAINEVGLQWADYLAKTYSCDRVCIGEVHGGEAVLQVVSGSSDHALNSAVTKKIRLAMQEAIDQQRRLCWPRKDDDVGIYVQLEKLSVAQNNACIACVPVFANQKSYLVLTFERPATVSFSIAELDAIDAHLSLAGACYETKRLADLSIWQVLARRLKVQQEKLFAHGYVKRKVVALCVLASVLFFSVVTGNYRISADAELEPSAIRLISAPFSGYLKSANVRAGDQVAKGAELLAMDDRDLRLTKIQAISQLSQANKQYTEALAEGDRAQAQIFLAKVEQAKAQLASADRDLERARVQAPYDALVVSGDLSQQVGAAINQGDELFRISPMTDYRLILFVSEFNIAEVELGQRGRVVFSSATDHTFNFEVTNLTPVAEVRDGTTVFRVEATFENDNQVFRPGLVGIGKIEVGEQLLIDMWTRDLRHWLSLKLWSFWG
ncbi:efflux RND transporter periplasmic adaptor subunit [Simiduia aestuariiviva]|uniref:RND efflux pump membrane fusion protein barrel-sandwich domain-containing protein n=1 Tax=Simiduia aestuariiviva TaxID=1510459 RepID=A0A839UPD1_9GAMM|nr:HlyD family efflux transporter periplasmic adaptor subunit [Simiduia aestuariiviva]MBB3169702.1 hypothetical protein [Simiduia aestuariiviva]